MDSRMQVSVPTPAPPRPHPGGAMQFAIPHPNPMPLPDVAFRSGRACLLGLVHLSPLTPKIGMATSVLNLAKVERK